MSATKPWRRGGQGNLSREAPRIARDRAIGMLLSELAAKYGVSEVTASKHSRAYAGLCGADIGGEPCIMAAGHSFACRGLPY